MKKHLKKVMLVLGFISIATISNARAWKIVCDNGKEFTYYSLENPDTLSEMRDVDQAIDDLCS